MRNIFFLLFLLPVITYAQSAMSLDECIRLAWKQNPSIRNSAINIKEARTDYAAAIGTFLPRIVANAETGKRFGRSIDPDTNGYTEKTFEEGTIGLDMTLSLFEGFSRINQVRFRKINRERSKWELKDRQNELAYQVTDAYYKLVLESTFLYKSDRNFGWIFASASLIAIFVACLGLWIVTLFSTLSRLKEVGIRKVLGANKSSLFFILTKELMLLTILASAIGIPVSAVLMNGWLETYAFHISLPWWIYAVVFALLMLIAFLTVFQQVWRIICLKPMSILKYE